MDAATQIRLEAASGVTFIVTPLTAIAQNAMRAKATQMANYPDPAEFEKPQENAFDETATISAVNDPEYVALYRAAIARRDTIFWNLILDVAVTTENRPDLDAAYTAQVKALRAVVTDSALSRDTASSDWALVVIAFLATESEVQQLIDGAQGRLPISDTELRGGFRFFR